MSREGNASSGHPKSHARRNTLAQRLEVFLYREVLFGFQKEQLSLLDGRTSMQCIEAVDVRAVAARLSSLEYAGIGWGAAGSWNPTDARAIIRR
jgi:hypothetical protein